MDAHSYVYHRNICIHHSLNEVVYSENPVKKRLNISMYFIKRTINFKAMYTFITNPMHVKKVPQILQIEVEIAIKEMRNKKATGEDDVPADVLKLLGDGGLEIMTKLVNTIYETGEWPKDFMEVTMIGLKKPQATKCNDHRTISLIAHTAKIVTKILRRIEKKIQEVLGEDQFGFRRGKGTRDAIGMLRILSERPWT